MNLTVYSAAPLPLHVPADERRHALPGGFPFIVDDEHLLVPSYPLRYLNFTFRKVRGTASAPQRRRRTSLHSVEAAAYDLVDFLRHLSHRSRGDPRQISTAEDDLLALDNFTIDDVFAYRDELYARVSKQTNEPLKDDTCARRIARALDYVKWLEGRGFVFESERPNLPRKSGEDDVVHPLSQDEWNRIRTELGPLPSEQLSGIDERPSRSRSSCQLSLETGLRVDEVANLTIHQILDLRFDPEAPEYSEVKLHVTKTKRLVARTVYVPMYLVRELHLYIDGERRDALAEAEKYWLAAKQLRPTALFVNGVDAHQHAGKPVAADVLSHDFHQACIRAGITRSAEKIDPLNGDAFVTQIARHHFHDLRHTYAVWRYYSEKAAGNNEPWKQIQTELGHAFLSTTLNIYLKVIPEERREVNKTVYLAIRERYSGN